MLKDYIGIYDIDENGVVTNLKTGKVLKHLLNKKLGYYQVFLCKDGVSTAHYVHRLLAEKYLPNFCTTLEVDHRDRDRGNNALSNLRMLTRQQNQWNNSGKGYYYDKRLGKWAAYVYLNNKKIWLGYHDTEAKAAAAAAAGKAKYHVMPE